MPTLRDDPGDPAPRLHLIDLDQDLPGQYRFISCWVSLQDDLVFLVDPGPPSTADHLIAQLEELGVSRLDFILLTHVHLDHAGCTARLLARWPAARVVCHEKGRPHLVDPTRLWQGSLAVLGPKAEIYGEPAPVPAAALADLEMLAGRGVEAILTPGHAAHHVSFRHRDHLFLGEAAGTFSDLDRGPDTGQYYLRPATPPRFFPEVAAASLGRLLDLYPLPRRLLFAHHGEFTGDTRRLLATARDQIDWWLGAAAQTLAGLKALPHSEQPQDETALMDLIATRLARIDPHFARGAELPVDIQARERDFTHQTMRGILGFLAG